MAAVHFFERTDSVRKIDKTRNEWETGYWPLTEETAKKLVGSVLYVHRSKRAPSHFGGDILDYRVEQSGPESGRVAFKLRAKADCKGVKTDAKGWSKDCKIVWTDESTADATSFAFKKSDSDPD